MFAIMVTGLYFLSLSYSNTVLIQNIVKKETYSEYELGNIYLRFKGRFDLGDDIYFNEAYAAYTKSLNIEDPAYYSLFVNTDKSEIDKYKETIKDGSDLWSNERFLMEIYHDDQIHYLVERYIEEIDFHAIFLFIAKFHNGTWKLDLSKDELNDYMFHLVSFYRRNKPEVYIPSLLDKILITLSPNNTVYDYNSYLKAIEFGEEITLSIKNRITDLYFVKSYSELVSEKFLSDNAIDRVNNHIMPNMTISQYYKIPRDSKVSTVKVSQDCYLIKISDKNPQSKSLYCSSNGQEKIFNVF